MDDPAIITWVLFVLGVIVIVIARSSRSRSLKRKNIEALPPDLWRDYRSALDGYERALRGLSYHDLPVTVRTDKFSSNVEKGLAAIGLFGLPAQSLPVNQIEKLLHIGDHRPPPAKRRA
jgi:hypothetical protein